MEINKRRNNNKIMTHGSSLEEVLEAIKPNHVNRVIKDMNGTMLLCPAHHPKVTSRNKLQIMFNAARKE